MGKKKPELTLCLGVRWMGGEVWIGSAHVKRYSDLSLSQLVISADIFPWARLLFGKTEQHTIAIHTHPEVNPNNIRPQPYCPAHCCEETFVSYCTIGVLL